MKLSVTQENFTKALSNVIRIANSRVSLPILHNIMLKAADNRLEISATNMDVAMISNIGAKIQTEGSVVVPAKLVTEFVANLPKTNVELELKDNKLFLSAGNYRSTINTVDIEDFPDIPEITKSLKIEIPTKLFKESVASVAPFASNDVTRPILTGVFCYTKNQHLYFVATDGYRLAEKKTIKVDQEIKVIIPASTLANIQQTISEQDENLEVLLSEDQISFNLLNLKITSKLIAGNYIDYQSLIPAETETIVLAEKSEFMRIIKISELFTRETAGSITIKADAKAGTLKIKSLASEIGENESELEAEVSADGEVTLNAKYLMEAVNNLTESKVSFGFSGKLAPALLTNEKDLDYKHIIMPIKS